MCKSIYSRKLETVQISDCHCYAVSFLTIPVEGFTALQPISLVSSSKVPVAVLIRLGPCQRGDGQYFLATEALMTNDALAVLL